MVSTKQRPRSSKNRPSSSQQRPRSAPSPDRMKHSARPHLEREVEGRGVNTSVATGGERVYRQQLTRDTTLPISWCLKIFGLMMLLALLVTGRRYALAQSVRILLFLDQSIVGLEFNLPSDVLARYTPNAYVGETAGGLRYVNGRLSPGEFAEEQLSQEQVDNLAAVLNASAQLDATQNEMIAVVMTVLQESSARPQPSCIDTDGNVNGGADFNDDSGGFFQQRPSQGWGTCQQVNDPLYSVDAFLNGIKGAIAPSKPDEPFDISGYRDARKDNPNASYGAVVQSVQRSDHPDEYHKWLPVAREIVRQWVNSADLFDPELPSQQEPNRPVEIDYAAEMFGGDDQPLRLWRIDPVVRITGRPDQSDIDAVLEVAGWFNQQMSDSGKSLRIVVLREGYHIGSNVDLRFESEVEQNAPGIQDLNNEIIAATASIDISQSAELKRLAVYKAMLQILGVPNPREGFTQNEVNSSIVRSLYKLQPGSTVAQLRQVYAQEN